LGSIGAVSALAAGPAGAATYGWRVSASLTGSYSNTHGWVHCAVTGAVARFAETARVDVRLRPRATARYRPANGNLLARGRVAAGGNWVMAGTYPPRQPIPGTSDEVCGPPERASCSGALEVDPKAAQSGDLLLFRSGSAMRGPFRAFPRLAESALRRTVPGPAICRHGPLLSTYAVFFGLGTTDIAARAWGSEQSFPASRLLRRKAFTVSGVRAGPDPEGCDGTYDPCTQAGSLRLKVTFRPA
jgi:hypothetical protein